MGGTSEKHEKDKQEKRKYEKITMDAEELVSFIAGWLKITRWMHTCQISLFHLFPPQQKTSWPRFLGHRKEDLSSIPKASASNARLRNLATQWVLHIPRLVGFLCFSPFPLCLSASQN